MLESWSYQRVGILYIILGDFSLHDQVLIMVEYMPITKQDLGTIITQPLECLTIPWSILDMGLLQTVEDPLSCFSHY